MELIRRFVEWYFCIPSAQAGQGHSFSLVYGEGTTQTWPFGLLLTGVAAAAALIWIYRIEAPQIAARIRWTLTGLRLAVLLALLAMISGASLAVQKTGLPYLVVLIDTSASMGIADQYQDRSQADSARRSVHAAQLSELQRLELAKAVLLDPQSSLIQRWQQRYRLKVYAFDDTLSPLIDDAVAEPEVLEKALRELRPLGPETRPAYCLEEVFNEYRGAAPAAIVILTDGIASRSSSELTTAAAQTARELSIPLMTVGIGSADPNRDLELTDLLVDRVAILGDPLLFRVRGRSWGTSQEKIRATLRLVNDPRPLASSEVESTGNPFSFELLTTPTEEGDHTYEIELTPLEGESTLENNRLTATVSVRRTKIRVLLVERHPRWEFRHLKPLLERDEMIELRTVLQDSDVDFVREDRTALAGFPPRASDLDEFDVIILGDVDITQINPQSLTHIRDFVSEKGGGLILIGGERHNPRQFSGTPLETLCPVPLDGIEPPTPQELAGDGFLMRPTPEGRIQAFLQLNEATATEDLWGSLPRMHWSWQVIRTKPGAITLTTQGGAGGRPVLVWQRYGAGQVLFHATDELWQWRQEREDAVYGRYWGQAIRQLCRAKLLGLSQRVKLTSDRPVYSVGEPIRLIARGPTSPPRGDGTGLTALVTSTGNPVRVPLVPISEGQYEGHLASLPAGQYQVVIDLPTAQPDDGCQFRVELPNREMRDRAANHADLELAAKTSRGQYYHWSNTASLARDIPPGHPVTQAAAEIVPLWNRGELYAVLLACLTMEWLLRRKSRLP